MIESGIVQLGSIVWIREVSTGDDSEIFVDEGFTKSPVGKLMTGRRAGYAAKAGSKRQAYKLLDVR